MFLTRIHVPLQIDPSILQQTLQQTNLVTQQLTGEPGLAPQGSSLQTPDGTVPASVVIQPISGLSLQPTAASANLTIGPLSEQEPVLTTSSGGKSQSPVSRDSWRRAASCSGPTQACSWDPATPFPSRKSSANKVQTRRCFSVCACRSGLACSDFGPAGLLSP